ncbi:MAG: ABC-F family ATP-binding cassette domain-containing protein [Planctomycetes bacterium]|nr:ABC-F family ATP-binding cassette domain-containing protein [Planctomycetota bacterium]
MAIIELHGVTKQFGTQIVLRDITLDLHANQTVGLIGANGAGKTTLFRLIAGELAPDLGNIVRGRGLEIGYLTQEPDISLEKTVREEVGSTFAPLMKLEDKLHAAQRRRGSICRHFAHERASAGGSVGDGSAHTHGHAART